MQYTRVDTLSFPETYVHTTNSIFWNVARVARSQHSKPKPPSKHSAKDSEGLARAVHIPRSKQTHYTLPSALRSPVPKSSMTKIVRSTADLPDRSTTPLPAAVILSDVQVKETQRHTSLQAVVPIESCTCSLGKRAPHSMAARHFQIWLSLDLSSRPSLPTECSAQRVERRGKKVAL